MGKNYSRNSVWDSGESRDSNVKNSTSFTINILMCCTISLLGAQTKSQPHENYKAEDKTASQDSPKKNPFIYHME